MSLWHSVCTHFYKCVCVCFEPRNVVCRDATQKNVWPALHHDTVGDASSLTMPHLTNGFGNTLAVSSICKAPRRAIGGMYADNLYLSNLYEFLDYKVLTYWMRGRFSMLFLLPRELFSPPICLDALASHYLFIEADLVQNTSMIESKHCVFAITTFASHL